MIETTTKKAKISQFVMIVLPILISQLGLFSMNFFDTVMSGQVSPTDLAGVAIGSSIWVPIFTGLSGILMALTPTVSQYVGAKENSKISQAVIQAIYLSIVISLVIIVIGIFFLKPILQSMDLETEVRFIAFNYLKALSFGLIPLFVYNVLRYFIDGLGHTLITMLITLLTLPINLFFNYVLIFGKFGFPRLGGVGAGYASMITYWCILFIAIIIIIRGQPFINYRIFHRLEKVSFNVWGRLMKIGIPIGFSIFFETSIFAAVTLLMSEFDTNTIAAHQSALNFASFLYMIPLSISMALTISVGYEVGAKRFRDAVQYSYIGISSAVLISLLSAIGLFIWSDQVAGLYTKDASVLELTKHFLYFAIFFQLSDAIAAPIQGALRGYKDVNSTFILAFVSFWVIGLPVGYYLANYTSYGAFGYWIGLISGLAVGAVCLIIRLIYIQKKKFISKKEPMLDKTNE
ncbi:MATE family efflux transporter [Chengkuizengella axinellae]|uniref:Probable multidrug resistance protein NorM n=1 Tax=Chengkuizengella axinellae TaxID=3064388 RepID=A0ABT9J3A8_9BACL|nr:MATE family efflux transporter [Chengkuizengella sp. 2205SS18-9]MDP5275474.1 MATE family efflux transporter [Chengkuizengella sp. 2205SS18-9]